MEKEKTIMRRVTLVWASGKNLTVLKRKGKGERKSGGMVISEMGW